MKTILLFSFGLCAAAWPAGAWPHNLENGLLVAHHEPQVEFSHDPPPGGWCELYAPYAISDTSQVVARMDAGSGEGRVWFVLAAWSEEKEWCGVEFGLGDYDAALFAVTSSGPCFPPGGGLEIPGPGWPGPTSGTSFVVTSQPWDGNFMPLYAFAGYVYAEAGPGVIPLAEHPQSGFGGWGSCDTPPELYAAVCFGAMGVNTDGVVCPFPPPPLGACCLEGSCLVLTEEECQELDMQWYPEWPSCDPNPCPQITSLCCLPNGICVLYETKEECDAMGGVWHPDWHT
jgi:hypothetical protein